MKDQKTNVMRILEQNGIPYTPHYYTNEDGKIDGVAVANKMQKAPETVYKTLVTRSTDKNLFVFVIPVTRELNLKKCAKAAGVKSVEMIHVNEINKLTGYIRGGCSPIGMKKQSPTFIDQQALEIETITVSAGKIGAQIELSAQDLAKVIPVTFADLV